MPKKLTPKEQHIKDLILKLISIHKALALLPRKLGEPGAQQEMANDIGVERETLNRWMNWRMPPRGLSVPAIEKYIERMEA